MQATALDMTSITVRLAGCDEASQLAPMFRAMYAEWGVEPPFVGEGLEASLAAAIKASGDSCVVLIAMDGEACAGFAVFGEVFEPAYLKPGGFLRDVFVLPGSRRRGVGTALMRAVLREADRRGWASLDWHVNRLDFDARTFFEVLAPDGYQVSRLVHRIDGETLANLAYSDTGRDGAQ